MRLKNKNIFGIAYHSLSYEERKEKIKLFAKAGIKRSYLYQLFNAEISNLKLRQIEVFCFLLDVPPIDVFKNTFVYQITNVNFVMKHPKKFKNKNNRLIKLNPHT